LTEPLKRRKLTKDEKFLRKLQNSVGNMVEIYFLKRASEKTRVIGRLASYVRESQLSERVSYHLVFSTLIFLKGELCPELLLEKSEENKLYGYEGQTLRNCCYRDVSHSDVKNIYVKNNERKGYLAILSK
jgi:hypothetical protein